MWSSVMKTTLQRLHSKMCGPSSGSGGRPVSRTVISRPQFGQVGFCSMTDKRLDGTKFRRREGYRTRPRGIRYIMSLISVDTKKKELVGNFKKQWPRMAARRNA